MKETEQGFKTALSYTVFAKIVNCISVSAKDALSNPKDLLLFLTSNAELVLVEFGNSEVQHVSKLCL